MIALLTLTVALVLAFIIALFQYREADRQFKEADRRGKIALSRQLAVQSQNLLDVQLDLALLLSVEACRTAATVEAQNAIFTALEKEPQIKGMLHGDKGFFSCVAISPDDQTVVAGATDGTIKFWDIKTHRPIGPLLKKHRGMIESVAFSPDGQLLASGSRDNTVIIWNAETQKPLKVLRGHKGLIAFVHTVAFSPDGKILASGSEDKTIIFWDLKNRKPLAPPLKGHKKSIMNISFSRDGTTLASGSEDRSFILWDLKTRKPLGQPLKVAPNLIYSGVFGPDGHTLASFDNEDLSLWNLKSRQLLGHPFKVKDFFPIMAFGPDGQFIASAGQYKQTILFDLINQKRQMISSIFLHSLNPLPEDDVSIASLAFSPDGVTLASGSEDKTISLWDVKTRRAKIPPLKGHRGPVRTLAFSPDGKLLASGSEDATVRLWDVDIQSWLKWACHIANRNLIRKEWERYMGDRPYRKTCPNLPGPEE